MEALGGVLGDAATFQQSGTSTASFANVAKEGENCFELVYEFCQKLLNIDDPKSKLNVHIGLVAGNRIKSGRLWQNSFFLSIKM